MMTYGTELKTGPLNELYSALPADLVERLRRCEQTQALERGAVLFCREVLPECLMVLTSGTVEIAVPCDSGLVTLGTAGPGKVFGLRSLVCDEGPNLIVTCLEPCSMKTVSKTEFMAVLHEHPEMYFAIAKVLSSDLALAQRFLKDCARKSRRVVHNHGQHFVNQA